jgi:hypothetical protein
MDTFLKLTPADQLDAYLEVNRAMGLDAASVEKDFWVCWTLRELFTAPGIGDHHTFKGGTSLSKAWKLIQRFSEDIDLIVNKEILGFGGDAAPDKAPCNKQRKARLEGLMDACRVWVQETLSPHWLHASNRHSAKMDGNSKSIPTCPTANACSSIIPRSFHPARPPISDPSSKSNSARAQTIGPM